MTKPVFRKIDCYSLPVDDLDKGIAFYASLGHALLWRDGNHSAGLSLPDSDDELVLRTDNRPFETCILVADVEAAIQSITEKGGTLMFGPIEIRIGKYALLHDPWGNPLPILDFTNGKLATDEAGNVIGHRTSSCIQ